jgi:hypothetical protein
MLAVMSCYYHNAPGVEPLPSIPKKDLIPHGCYHCTFKKKGSLMDASSRFTSPRLQAVKRETNIRKSLSSRELSQLIFDEINEMDQVVFKLLFDGNETGVAIHYGKRTISYRDLKMSPSDVVGISASLQPLLYDRTPYHYKHGDGPMKHIWGLLMVRCDRQLIWVKAQELTGEHSVTELTPELLAELMDTQYEDSDSQVLFGAVVYEHLVHVMIRKSNYYTSASNRLVVHASGMQESLKILKRPGRDY